jgi:hypothetical protein
LNRNLRIKVVDAAGEPLPNITMQLQCIAGTGELDFVPGGYSDKKEFLTVLFQMEPINHFYSLKGQTLYCQNLI